MRHTTLGEALERTPPTLRLGLEWFHARGGTEISWPAPSPISGLPHLVTQAKGIYKPKGFDYALSVRQTLDSPYSDREVIPGSAGGWIYGYHQESADAERRDEEFTNVALLANMDDGVPVAVLIQTAKKPRVRYRVLGLARVASWSDGIFFLEGFDRSGVASGEGAQVEDSLLAAVAAREVAAEASGPLDHPHDARLRVRTSIVRRRGQGAFRRRLLDLYGGRCIVTGCEVEAVLDAAHIEPYRGEHSNAATNGILLRTDLHTLFDSGLMAIDPETRQVLLAPRLGASSYVDLAGSRIREPNDPEQRPHPAHLKAHLMWCADRLHPEAS